jgi:protein farnesyltransferase/geranylgeranyltransferase type-1 subunit alpha
MEIGDYVPIKQRPEWVDFAPLRPPQASTEVVAIHASSDQKDLMDCFWAALTTGELSHRVLDLTEEIILGFNAAHFSVWEWRWRCLNALGMLTSAEGQEKEEALMMQVAADNPKNYQLWNHRRRFAMLRGSEHAQSELKFSQQCMVFDAKNYHAWAHRQAILLEFSHDELWLQEMEYTSLLLEDDPRNNSAWNQRIFVLERTQQTAKGNDHENNTSWLLDELSFVSKHLEKTVHNEALWVYLRRIALLAGKETCKGFGKRLLVMCLEALRRDSSNLPALEFLVDTQVARLHDLCNRLKEAVSVEDKDEVLARAQASHNEIKALLLKLAQANPIRAGYYRWCISQIGNLDGGSARQ